MSTSGISQFNLDIADVMEEAYERIGRELRSGYDAITARRSLNILFQEFINQGIELWTLEQRNLVPRPGVAAYPLPSDTSDVLPEAFIRMNTDQDFPVTRITHEEYFRRTPKDFKARPLEFVVERQTNGPLLTLWPIPDQAIYQFFYYRVRYMQDIVQSTDNPDMPRRFLPPLISGLAFHLANKAGQGVDAGRRAELYQYYQKDLKDALEEDRDRSSFFIVPDNRNYGRR